MNSIETKMFAKIFLLGLLVAAVACDQVVINEAIDQLLESARLALKLKGSNKIDMKPLDKTFNTKIFGMNIPGKFAASGGYLEDLATIQRTGDVAMSTEGNVLKLRASLGFGLLHVFYGQYAFEYLSVKSSGTMEVSMTNSALTAALSVIRNGDQCNVLVDQASIDSLGEIKVNLSGPSVLNQFITMLLNWVTENFHDTIKVTVNSKMIEALKTAVSKTDLCSKLPH